MRTTFIQTALPRALSRNDLDCWARTVFAAMLRKDLRECYRTISGVQRHFPQAMALNVADELLRMTNHVNVTLEVIG